MTKSLELKLALGLAVAAGMTFAGTAARAQETPAGQTPQGALQIDNGGKRAIVAVYSSPPGRADWSDDILGKTALKPGQSRKLTLKVKPQGCKVDIFAMQDNGDTSTKRDIDLCAATPSAGF